MKLSSNDRLNTLVSRYGAHGRGGHQRGGFPSPGTHGRASNVSSILDPRKEIPCEHGPATPCAMRRSRTAGGEAARQQASDAPDPATLLAAPRPLRRPAVARCADRRPPCRRDDPVRRGGVRARRAGRVSVVGEPIHATHHTVAGGDGSWRRELEDPPARCRGEKNRASRGAGLCPTSLVAVQNGCAHVSFKKST